MSKTRFGVALLGCGTVGQGVYELLQGQARDIASKYGFQFEVRKILVRDKNKPRNGLKIPKDVFTTNFEDVLADEEVDIVIEVMGGESPAREYLMEALRSKRRVITANKTLMGAWGEKLVERARQQDRFFGFSAAVTGFHQFVPSIVKSIMITELVGVFNGTTNFILTKLAEKSFDEVLEEAIRFGYAEADHTNDTEGFDTRNKLVVATKLAFGLFLNREEIPVSGITGITKEDIGYARKLGYAVKLLGVSRIVEDNKLTAFVSPALVPLDDPLASIQGVDNGIVVSDSFRGVQGMIGAGAGKDATAMAIFSDLIGVGKGEKTLWPDASLSRRSLKFTKNQPDGSFYVRVEVASKPGVLATVTKHFARNGINIKDVMQKEGTNDPVVSIVFLTHPTKPKNVQKFKDEIMECGVVVHKPIVLRVEHSPRSSSHSEAERAAKVADKAALVPA